MPRCAGGRRLRRARAAPPPTRRTGLGAPLNALVGESKAGKGSVRFRQALVLTQFMISIAVIASTLLMAQQMRYVAERPLGFAKENRMMVTLRGADLIENEDTIRNELSGDSGILGMSTSDSMLGRSMSINVANVENNDGTLAPITVSHMGVGDDFLSVMGMQVVEGRDFSRRLLTDVGSTFVVNETFVRNMGWEEPLGKRIQLGANSGRVIGVVADFNFASLHTVVEPFAVYPIQTDFSNVFGRQSVLRYALARAEPRGRADRADAGRDRGKVCGARPRSSIRVLLPRRLAGRAVRVGQNLTSLIGIFGGICVFIACLGLFGLAAFTTEQRTKEIGIRKVLGASAGQIIWLLSRNILLLIAVGAVLASVIAWFAIDEWLAGFAYRAAINPLVFVVATLVAAVVAYVTIAPYEAPVLSQEAIDLLTGQWVGQLDTGAGSLAIVFRFETGDDGALVGFLDSPDQGATGMAIANVEWIDGELSFRMPQVNGEYTATVDGTDMTGTWSQGAVPMSLNMSRGEYTPTVTTLDLSAEDLVALGGAWSGTLGPLEIVMRLETNADGEAVGYLDVPAQGASGVSITEASFADGGLSLSIASIGVQYTAEVSGNEMEGEWAQGPQTNRLTLRRQAAE